MPASERAALEEHLSHCPPCVVFLHSYRATGRTLRMLKPKELPKNLADAVMWTYHGREFPAPTFELGMAPAGCMYSTVLDLAKFQHCLFAGGKLGGKQLLKPETIAEMFRPQFAEADEKRGFGLGFFVSEFEGKRRVSHGGAIYGFATTFAMLPGEKLGLVSMTGALVSRWGMPPAAPTA